MTEDKRETFGIIVAWLRVSDPVWWTTILLIEKLNVRGCRYDSAWDESLHRDELHDAGLDDT